MPASRRFRRQEQRRGPGECPGVARLELKDSLEAGQGVLEGAALREDVAIEYQVAACSSSGWLSAVTGAPSERLVAPEESPVGVDSVSVEGAGSRELEWQPVVGVHACSRGKARRVLVA